MYRIIGHYWVARFLNGIAAQFLPDHTENFVVTERSPDTAVVFINRKGFSFLAIFSTISSD